MNKFVQMIVLAMALTLAPQVLMAAHDGHPGDRAEHGDKSAGDKEGGGSKGSRIA